MKSRVINRALLIFYEHWRVMTIQIVEFCEIPFIGYLVMTQFIDFSAIQGQLLIAYWSYSDKMQTALMCYCDI